VDLYICGMRRLSLLVVTCIWSSFLWAQSSDAYQWFSGEGKKRSYAQVLKSLEQQIAQHEGPTVLLFGELHDDPIAHWMQKQLTADLYAIHSKMALGAEMFERDQQWALNTYLNPPADSLPAQAKAPSMMSWGGDPAYSRLKKSINLWPNTKTDYLPLLEFAREKNIPFWACNIPRRLANQIYMKGIGSFDSLAADQKAWVAPLPFAYDSSLRCYADIFAMAGGHGGQNLPMAQASKDATMAYSISEHLNGIDLFIHYNGAYHSDYFESMVWYLKQYAPQAQIITLSTQLQDEMQQLDREEDKRRKADFILATNSSMTRTH